MRTNLRNIEKCVNLLTLSGITLLDLDEVDAWLCALDIQPQERRLACQRIMGEGRYDFSNVEHRVTVECIR